MNARPRRRTDVQPQIDLSARGAGPTAATVTKVLQALQEMFAVYQPV